MEIPLDWKKKIRQDRKSAIRIEEYQKLSFEQYSRQIKLKLRLEEMDYLNPVTCGLLGPVLRRGVYLEVDKIKPIIGPGHWKEEEWSKFEKLISNEIYKNEIEKVLNSLVDETAMYRCPYAGRKNKCNPNHKSCYLTDCKIAEVELKKQIEKEYKKMTGQETVR